MTVPRLFRWFNDANLDELAVACDAARAEGAWDCKGVVGRALAVEYRLRGIDMPLAHADHRVDPKDWIEA